MSNIKNQIVTLLKQRHHSHKVALDQEKDPRSKHAVDLIARIREDSQLIELIDSLPEETCKDSLQVQETCKENTYSFTSLDEAAEKYSNKYCSDWAYRLEYEDAFIAGAEWMRKKDVEDMYMSDNRHFLKCYEQGKVDMKVKMMNDAVEGYVAQRVHGELYAKAKVPESMNLKFGDKVKIVIIKGND